jgi:hypothetical protein
LTKDLYTTKDVAEVREILLKEQKGIDPITGQLIPAKKCALDHDHKTQHVRGVLHLQSNAVLGKLENLWPRYLSWWYEGTLSSFLRGCADYIEDSDKKEPRYNHPAWIRKVGVEFNKLSEGAKDRTLINLGSTTGKNSKERKALFGKVIKSKRFTFKEILEKMKNMEL